MSQCDQFVAAINEQCLCESIVTQIMSGDDGDNDDDSFCLCGMIVTSI